MFNSVKKWPLIIVWMQVLLGIASIISSAGIIPGKWGLFEWMAQLHQLGGMMLLLSLIMVFYITSGKSNTN
jgi:cytochrome c oxidase assembly protein subunit 15